MVPRMFLFADLFSKAKSPFLPFLLLSKRFDGDHISATFPLPSCAIFLKLPVSETFR